MYAATATCVERKESKGSMEAEEDASKRVNLFTYNDLTVYILSPQSTSRRFFTVIDMKAEREQDEWMRTSTSGMEAMRQKASVSSQAPQRFCLHGAATVQIYRDSYLLRPVNVFLFLDDSQKFCTDYTQLQQWLGLEAADSSCWKSCFVECLLPTIPVSFCNYSHLL